MPHPALEQLLTLAALDASRGGAVELTGSDPVVPTRFRVGMAAAAAVAAAATAAAEVLALRTGASRRQDIAVEIAAAAGAPHGPDGPLYPGTCRGLPPEERAARMDRGLPYALRLDAAAAARLTGPLTWEEDGRGTVAVDPTRLGDAVLARKDIAASYHLAVTVDDALQDVTLVTRGEDLFHATHLHRLLQALLGLAAPDYAHHILLTNADGRRLAKRDGALALRALRLAGRTPAEVRAMAGFPD